MFKRIYHGCARCNHVLHRNEWLLDSAEWDLQKIGSGGNGQVYKATCRETRCEHAAKFLPYSSGRWECDMAEKAKSIDARFVVKVICSGVSRNPIGCGDAGPQCIALLLELMDGDLFDVVLSPSNLSDHTLRRSCALRHIAYQLLQAIRAIHEAQIIHDDVKLENVMVKYLPNCAFLKIGDFGNAVALDCNRRIGGTYAYMAPENVIGLRNRGCLGDVFASAMVLVELACRSTIMPESLVLGYGKSLQEKYSTGALRWTQLYHLVLLSSLIAQRPTFAGLVVRRYYGNISRERTIGVLTSHFPNFHRDIDSMIAKTQRIKQTNPVFFCLVQAMLTREEQRPSAEKALSHSWFSHS